MYGISREIVPRSVLRKVTVEKLIFDRRELELSCENNTKMNSKTNVAAINHVLFTVVSGVPVPLD